MPDVLRGDIWPEFLGEVPTAWVTQSGMAIHYIQPGKPNQNAGIERFNRTDRGLVLDQFLFTSKVHVREATQWWVIEYNEDRLHDVLNDLTPLEARQRYVRNSNFELPT